jgi:hypothetical protein
MVLSDIPRHASEERGCPPIRKKSYHEIWVVPTFKYESKKV